MKSIDLIRATMALAIALAATPALAVNWVYFTSNLNGTSFSYDADTLRRSGDQVTAWERWDHSRDKTEKLRERQVLSKYDCVQRTLTYIELIDFHPDGKIDRVSVEPHIQRTVNASPGSIIEKGLEAVCSSK